MDLLIYAPFAPTIWRPFGKHLADRSLIFHFFRTILLSTPLNWLKSSESLGTLPLNNPLYTDRIRICLFESTSAACNS